MSLTAAVTLAMSSAATLPSCSWDRPGADPFMGDVVAAVDRYKDIPAPVRAALKKRMALRQYDEMATIRRDSISGLQRYSPEIRDMHFGQGRMCRTVTRAAWSPTTVERGLVYCESEHCIIVPTVCRNVSRVTRLPPEKTSGAGGGSPMLAAAAPPGDGASPGVLLASAGPKGEAGELVFEPPGAGGSLVSPQPASALAALPNLGGGPVNNSVAGIGGPGTLSFDPVSPGFVSSPGFGPGLSPGISIPGPGGGVSVPVPVPVPGQTQPPVEVQLPDVREPIPQLPDQLPLPPILQITPAIPEPGTWALWLSGLATVVLVARRRRRAL